MSIAKASPVELVGTVNSARGGSSRSVTIVRTSAQCTLCWCPCGFVQDEGFLCVHAVALVLSVKSDRQRYSRDVADAWDPFAREFIAPQLSTEAWRACYSVDAVFPSTSSAVAWCCLSDLCLS